MTTTKTLVEALCDAQREMPPLPLDGFNPHYRSKFTTLKAVLETIVPVLNKHGIYFSQEFAHEEGSVSTLRTTLRKGGEGIVSNAVMPSVPDVQKWAAAATYIRRISAMSIVGAVGDPDFDAEDVVRTMKHSPLPDVAPEGSEQWADALRTHLNAEDSRGIWRIHLDLKEAGEDAYSGAWKLLDSKERTAIKAMIATEKERNAGERF